MYDTVQSLRQMYDIVQPLRQMYDTVQSLRQMYAVMRPLRQMYGLAQLPRKMYVVVQPLRQMYALAQPLRQMYAVVQPHRQLYALVQSRSRSSGSRPPSTSSRQHAPVGTVMNSHRTDPADTTNHTHLNTARHLPCILQASTAVLVHAIKACRGVDV
jgi:hypothetical protein